MVSAEKRKQLLGFRAMVSGLIDGRLYINLGFITSPMTLGVTDKDTAKTSSSLSAPAWVSIPSDVYLEVATRTRFPVAHGHAIRRRVSIRHTTSGCQRG